MPRRALSPGLARCSTAASHLPCPLLRGGADCVLRPGIAVDCAHTAPDVPDYYPLRDPLFWSMLAASVLTGFVFALLLLGGPVTGSNGPRRHRVSPAAKY